MKVSMVAAIAAGLAVSAQAAIVQVQATGVVEFNGVRSGAFDRALVHAGDAATMTFLLDSDNFVNGSLFPTRGYIISPSSFNLTIGVGSTTLANPYPAGETPYFILRNNDPAVDGFLLGSHPDVGFANGVATNEPGRFDTYLRDAFMVTYGGDTLSSLNILDALGTYDYDGLTVYGWTLTDGGLDAMGIGFTQMTISVVPAPASLAAFGLLAGFARRRR